jgi:hypothetical protein
VADYTHVLGRSRRLRELATATRQERESRNHARLAAYRWLATEPQGQVLLDDMALVLLKPCLTPEEEGERRCILKIFAAIDEAVSRDEEEFA